VPCEDCPWEDLTHDDRFALRVWGLVAPLGDLGLAPFALEALDLALTPAQAMALVTRLSRLARFRSEAAEAARERGSP